MTDDIKTPPARRSRPLLLGAILSGIALLAVALLTVLLVLHRQEYRAPSDRAFVKTLIDEAGEDDFFRLALPYLEENLSDYEELTAVKATYQDRLAPSQITFARADGYTETSPVYILYAGGRETFLLTLVAESHGLSGKARWAVGSLTVSPHCALGYDVSMEVPHGALLTVNGVSLSAEKAEQVPYHALSELEASLSDTYYCDRYTVGRIFLEPDVSVVLDGVRLQPSELDGTTLRFDYPSSYTASYSYTVPYGTTVTLNGIPLSAQYLVSSGVPYPYLTRFEADLPDAARSVVYQVTGLFREPTVTVAYGDVILTRVENGRYALPESASKTVTICAPDYATVKLNGVSLGKSEMVGVRFDVPILAGVTNHAKERPLMIRYQVTGLLDDPVITATDKNGKPLTISVYDSNEEETVFACSEGEEMPDKELLTVRTFAKAYLKYAYSASSGLSSNYSAVVSMTPSKTPAYTALKAEYKALQNATVHKSIKFGDVKLLHYYPISETAYAAVVEVPFTAKVNGETQAFTITMEILCVYSGNIRRVVNYRVLDS